MTYFFLDSSALSKRYMSEHGTEWIREITLPSAGNTIIIAAISQVEIIAEVIRLKEERLISSDTVRSIRRLLEYHVRHEYLTTALTPTIMRHAEDLLAKYKLDLHEAVQLASALTVNARLMDAELGRVWFVSADFRLFAASGSENLAFDIPIPHFDD